MHAGLYIAPTHGAEDICSRGEVIISLAQEAEQAEHPKICFHPRNAPGSHTHQAL